METLYTKEEMIMLVNDYLACWCLGEISTPDFELWLNNNNK